MAARVSTGPVSNDARALGELAPGSAADVHSQLEAPVAPVRIDGVAYVRERLWMPLETQL